jgi:fructokinase
MKTIVCIGEYLVDMLPETSGVALHDVNTFIKKPGGAPINVAVGIKRLGGKVQVVTQVGQDAFGHFLIETLKKEDIVLDYVYQTDQAKTSLAFVSLDQHGERDFVFYRDPSADQLLNLQEDIIENIDFDILHFGSVGLAEYPLKTTTDRFIAYADKQDKLISFDVNVRLMLFKDTEKYKLNILAYMKKAHVIKCSKEELVWLTGIEDIEKAIKKIWCEKHVVILISDGEHGVYAYTKDKTYYQSAFKVDVIDTTGAGDALMGSFLHSASKQKHLKEDIEKWLPMALEKASFAGALACTKKGAMSSLPFEDAFLKK